VTAAVLTVTADDHTKAYGAGESVLDGALHRLREWDTASSLTTPPTVSDHGDDGERRRNLSDCGERRGRRGATTRSAT